MSDWLVWGVVLVMAGLSVWFLWNKTGDDEPDERDR